MSAPTRHHPAEPVVPPSITVNLTSGHAIEVQVTRADVSPADDSADLGPTYTYTGGNGGTDWESFT